ncbi:TPA: acyl-CoA dehydrogenase family protein [Streptococcus suis]
MTMLFDQERIDKIQKFIQEQVIGKARYYDINERFPERLWAYLSQELGIFDLLVTYPDRAVGFRTFLEIIRQLSLEFASLASIAYTQGIYGISLLNRFGSPEQKQAYLADLVSCQKMGVFAFSEKDIDLERELPSTIARQVDDGWVISGVKHKIANASLADVVFVLAKTIDTYGKKGTGIFIVDRQQKGVTVGESVEKIGLRAMPLAPMSFEGVRLPSNSLLGGVEAGLQQWQATLMDMWGAIAAQSLGIAEGVHQKGITCSQLKRNFGKRPIDVTINQIKFAEIETKLAACKAYYQEYLRSDMQEKRAILILKVLTSETARSLSEEVIRITGSYHFLAENDIERYVRDAEVASTYGGTNDGMRRKIAQKWL